MPMVRQLAISMLACARIGAIHSVVFGGFAAKELATRIDDCLPSLIITCSTGIEPTKYIKYLPIVQSALSMCTKLKNAHAVPKLYYNRPELDGSLLEDKGKLDCTFFDMQELLDKETRVAPPVFVDSNHPLYILYTSGTTGSPKGVVRDQAGTTVALNWSFASTFNYHPGHRYFGAADIGWIVGHSKIVYGAMIRGITSVIYEGKPIHKGDPGALFSIIQKYGVEHLFISTTAVKEYIKHDEQAKFLHKFDLDCLKILSIGGEKTDPHIVWWLRKHFPQVVHNDTYWPTENGWPMGSNMFNKEFYGPVFPTLPGAIPRLSPGWNMRILDN